MSKKVSALLLTIISLIMATTLLMSTVAFAKVNPGAVFVPNPGGEGGGTVVFVGDKHIEEAKNFASISGNALTCETKINTWYFSRPDKNASYNDIDYVIYMISELEKHAMNYTNSDLTKAINCTLGYIRGINKNYAGNGEQDGNSTYDGVEWNTTCGSINKEFISYVASKETAGKITFPEFFASFLQDENSYNSYLYGAVDNTFFKHYLVKDPLGTDQNIDLLHMIASMDGIYKNTGYNEVACVLALGNTHIQRDLVSWSGDLQQLIASFGDHVIEEKNYNLADKYIDFNDYLNGQNFSSSDLLADIDAFNMTKFFLDSDKNSISNCFLGYYNSINKNISTKGNRFYEFIYTATLELEGDRQSSYLENFRKEVCNAVNVGYLNGNYWEENIHSGYTIKFMDDVGFDKRKVCAKLFCDYIIAVSGRVD